MPPMLSGFPTSSSTTTRRAVGNCGSDTSADRAGRDSECQTSAMHVEAGDAVQELSRTNIDWQIVISSLEQITQALEGGLGDEQRARLESGVRQQLAHDESTLRHEHAPLAQQRRVGHRSVVGQAIIVDVVNWHDGHSRTLPPRWSYAAAQARIVLPTVTTRRRHHGRLSTGCPTHPGKLTRQSRVVVMACVHRAWTRQRSGRSARMENEVAGHAQLAVGSVRQ